MEGGWASAHEEPVKMNFTPDAESPQSGSQIKWKMENYKPFRKKIEENSRNLGLGREFSDLTPQAPSMKEI